MSDVFISYADEDRPLVAKLVALLEQQGVCVWWDRTIRPGRAFDDAIEAALDAAKCVVVVWSTRSVKSRWVRAEAAEAERRSILIPVQIESATLPLEFRRLQTIQLLDWAETPQHPELPSLLHAVREVLGTAHDPMHPASAVPPAMGVESQPPSALQQPDGTSTAAHGLRHVGVFLALALGLWFLGPLFQSETARWVMIALVGVYLWGLYIIRSQALASMQHGSWTSEAKRASPYVGVFLFLAFALWFFGPFVALGDLALLHSARSRWVAIGLIGVCVGGLFVHRRRASNAPARLSNRSGRVP